MKKGFSLIELIISVSLLSLVGTFAFFVIKKAEPTYADPYEDLRKTISDATNLYLNSNAGVSFKEELYNNRKLTINSDKLIQEGLLEESYFVKNINEEKKVNNIEIIIILDEEGFIKYAINIQ